MAKILTPKKYLIGVVERFAFEAYEDPTSRSVTDNLYAHHLKPLPLSGA
jgi:hypothetical protein